MNTGAMVATMLWVCLAAWAGRVQAVGPSPAEDVGKSGIYLLAKEGEPTRIPGVMSQDMQTSGVAKSVFTYGMSKPHFTITHPGAHADVATAEKTPTFEFRFGPGMSGYQAPADPLAMMEMMDGLPAMTNSPKQFALARLLVEGDARKIEAGKNPTVKCTVTEVAKRVFRVAVAEPLEPGEYAFYVSDASKGGGNGAQIWPFTVKAGS